MTPAQLVRVFDPFYTTKEKGEGTGLRLAVVHGIVKNHGGAIQVYSEPGAGSTFNVFVPALERTAAHTQVQAPENAPIGDERVLFMDDEPSIVALTTRLLTILGYDVTAFTSSLEAMEHFKAQPEAFDIVISDMTMPQMTGDEVARQVLAIRPETPVILCSGFVNLINETDAKHIGISVMLAKPLSKMELATTIRTVLDGKPD